MQKALFVKELQPIFLKKKNSYILRYDLFKKNEKNRHVLNLILILLHLSVLLLFVFINSNSSKQRFSWYKSWQLSDDSSLIR